MEYLSGHLLIADPRLADMNFFRSVVLVTRHNDEGALGLVLNHPSNVWLADIWDKLSDSPLAHNDRLYFGGPVEGPLSVLHRSPEYSELQVLSDVHFSINRLQLDPLLASEGITWRVFSGYSGWGPGQLEQELEVGGWLTMPASGEHVFADPESLYRSVCETIGGEILFADGAADRFPTDPSMN